MGVAGRKAYLLSEKEYLIVYLNYWQMFSKPQLALIAEFCVVSAKKLYLRGEKLSGTATSKHKIYAKLKCHKNQYQKKIYK